MNIFITGGSGFIGSKIIERLSGEHQFFAMARSEHAAKKLMELGATPIHCELGAVKPEHMSNCDMIIHAAAFVKEWGTREQFMETTVKGTEQLIDAAKKAGIKKFIHISTEAVLFVGKDLNNIDETYPYPNKSQFLYSESKLLAEKLVLEANEPNRFEVMVIRPRMVWGPGDQTILPILVDFVKKNKFMWVNDGKNITSTTHIYNLVHGIKCAMNQWKPQQVYFITDDEIKPYKEFLTRYIGTQGLTPPNKSISKFMARTVSEMIEFIWINFRLKSTPPLIRLAAYMISSNFSISHAKATREIGYKPIISEAEGMAELSQTHSS